MNPPAELRSRAWQAYRAGDRPEAERACWELLAAQPLDPDAVYLLGVLALDAGQLAPALLHLHHASVLQASNAAYHHALGEAYRLAGCPEQAASSLLEALRLDPAHAAAHHALGQIWLEQGDRDAAAASFRHAIRVRPDYERAHLNLGRVLHEQGDLEAAIACFREAVRLQPDYAIAHNNLGAALLAQGRPADAEASLRQALRSQPNYPEAHCNLGHALLVRGDPTAAAASFREAIRLRPDYAKAHFGLARAVEGQGDLPATIAALRVAARLQPDYVEALERLGDVLMQQPDWEGSQEALRRVLALRPEADGAFARLAFARQMVCDWRSRTADLERVWADAARRLEAGEPTPVVPFQALTLPWPAERLLAVARSHSRPLTRGAAGGPQSFEHPRTRVGRLRIGYLSGDFYNHPIGILIQGLFARHDRGDFEVFAYSFGRDDGTPYRRRVEAGCDQFRDIAALSVDEAAQRIAADGIHILVDLMGHTGYSRVAVLARRPAPIQVSYLGMVGTMGAEFLDYLITDRVVSPPERAGDFDERLVWMPHSYLVNDHQHPIADRPATRAECGLPAQGFVFCCFNNSYKIEPEVFGDWMAILAEVPGSVLWLYASGASCEANLRREAEARGIAPGRLVFVGRRPIAEYLAQHRLADLFLDTHVYNGHSTVSLALWAGLPVLTCPGSTFASRVGASVLAAAGLSGLIAADRADYRRLAVSLARDPEALRRLRATLAEGRDTCPLFDAPRFARNLERAYRAMWDRYASGRPPEPIAIVEFP
ncbi:MAG: protein O-GlcNAc transferase [Chthoniobacter sp.]|jgi:predicted O-linked N-acetylglucosamine transferase (SPINDLY family)|nr:protein O-GlcNAc transferase [Chthoniobacter sp.]